MTDWDKSINVLNSLLDNGIQFSVLIRTIVQYHEALSPIYADLIENLFASADSIASLFLNNPQSKRAMYDWAHDHASQIYCDEIGTLTELESGLQFNASKTHAHQVMKFDINSIIYNISIKAPYLWSLSSRVLRTDRVVEGVSSEESKHKTRQIVSTSTTRLFLCIMFAYSNHRRQR